METTNAHWKLRRIAARAIKVYARHAPTSLAIAAYETSLLAAAQAFIAAYDASTGYMSIWRKEMDEGRGSMAALKSAMDMWKPHVARELPGMDLTTIGDKPSVPEDLIEDGIRLAEALATVVNAEGAAPTWATSGAADVRAKAQAAEKETDEAAAADSRLSELQSSVRSSGAALEMHLTLFRQSLLAVVGRSHPDYQKLRAQKAASKDEDDDPAAPNPSPPVTPAPTPPA